jgi:hypothetical protein
VVEKIFSVEACESEQVGQVGDGFAGGLRLENAIQPVLLAHETVAETEGRHRELDRHERVFALPEHEVHTAVLYNVLQHIFFDNLRKVVAENDPLVVANDLFARRVEKLFPRIIFREMVNDGVVELDEG